MKSKDSHMIFWWWAVILCIAGLEWLLIEVALKETRQSGWVWVWLFPFFVLPAALSGGMLGFFRTKSKRQRLAQLKYLAVYLPCIGIPIAAQTYMREPTSSWVWAVALPVQILVLFWFWRKEKVIQRKEALWRVLE